jgi:hypothetical protein
MKKTIQWIVFFRKVFRGLPRCSPKFESNKKGYSIDRLYLEAQGLKSGICSGMSKDDKRVRVGLQN